MSNMKAYRYDHARTEEEQINFITKESDPSSSSDALENPSWRKSTPNRLAIIAGVSSAFAVSLFLLILVLARQQHSSTDIVAWDFQGGSHTTEHCGNTTEEAKARGCIWDLMNFSWTHPKCYDKAVSDAFIDTHGPWKWFKDHNATQPLADEELPYQIVVYTEHGYHMAHCAYIFKMLHVAGMNRRLVTSEMVGLKHTDHCAMVLTKPEYTDFQLVTTYVDLLFERCVTLDS